MVWSSGPKQFGYSRGLLLAIVNGRMFSVSLEKAQSLLMQDECVKCTNVVAELAVNLWIWWTQYLDLLYFQMGPSSDMWSTMSYFHSYDDNVITATSLGTSYPQVHGMWRSASYINHCLLEHHRNNNKKVLKVIEVNVKPHVQPVTGSCSSRCLSARPGLYAEQWTVLTWTCIYSQILVEAF